MGIRDQQRSRMYAWECKHLRGRACDDALTLKQCQQLVNKIARSYKLKPPTVTDGRGRSNACWTFYQHAIKLPRWARSRVVCLHEAAHWITGQLFSRREVAAHGREFVAVFMYLLHKHAGVTVEAMTKTANADGLDFAGVQSCKPNFKGIRK